MRLKTLLGEIILITICLNKNDTRSIMGHLSCKKAVDAKWLLKIKRDKYANDSSYKIKFVPRGLKQRF